MKDSYCSQGEMCFEAGGKRHYNHNVDVGAVKEQVADLHHAPFLQMLFSSNKAGDVRACHHSCPGGGFHLRGSKRGKKGKSCSRERGKVWKRAIVPSRSEQEAILPGSTVSRGQTERYPSGSRRDRGARRPQGGDEAA